MLRHIAFERSALAACCAAVVGLGACYIDRSPGQEPAARVRDSSASEAAKMDGGLPDAAESSVNASVRYKVPAAGGTVTVTASSGHSIAFAFPPSAGGLEVVLTAVATDVQGWRAGQFSDAVRMEPDGHQFEEPVLITPSSADVLLMTLQSGDRVPEGLPLDRTRKSFELRHFSTLVVVAPNASCGNASGWHAQSNATQCEGFGSSSTYVDFTCNTNPLCQRISAHCCAPANAKLCRLGNPNLVLSYSPQGSADDMFPYCTNGVALDAGTPDAGKVDASKPHTHKPDAGKVAVEPTEDPEDGGSDEDAGA